VANENIAMRQEKLEGVIEMTFSHGDGVERIKKAFSDIEDGIEVSYISAPEYSITAWGRTQELAKKRIDEAVRSVREKVDDLDGSFEFSRA
jgi:translation initiation factor 2 alpha subunit (eIF-2alpha)